MKVRCPQCGNATEYSTDNKYRPFCSERCSLIDLGQWADEKYRVPVKSVADIDADHSEDGSGSSSSSEPIH